MNIKPDYAEFSEKVRREHKNFLRKERIFLVLFLTVLFLCGVVLYE